MNKFQVSIQDAFVKSHPCTVCSKDITTSNKCYKIIHSFANAKQPSVKLIDFEMPETEIIWCCVCSPLCVDMYILQNI